MKSATQQWSWEKSSSLSAVEDKQGLNRRECQSFVPAYVRSPFHTTSNTNQWQERYSQQQRLQQSLFHHFSNTNKKRDIMTTWWQLDPPPPSPSPWRSHVCCADQCTNECRIMAGKRLNSRTLQMIPQNAKRKIHQRLVCIASRQYNDKRASELTFRVEFSLRIAGGRLQS